MERKKLIYTLIIDLSFIPQAVGAALLFFTIRRESPILINTHVSEAFMLVCAEIIIFAFLCVIKRFYLLRALLTGAYAQLLITAYYYEYGKAFWNTMTGIWILTVFGVTITAANAYALYKYRQLATTRQEKTDE